MMSMRGAGGGCDWQDLARDPDKNREILSFP